MLVEYWAGADALPFSENCASIHTAAFLATGARGWTINEFEDLFRRESIFLLKTENGFLLADSILDEVEILVVAVDPSNQRQKIGHALMNKLDETNRCCNINRCILEVAEDNVAALNLYRAFNYRQFAIRESYFKTKNGPVAALMMSKTY